MVKKTRRLALFFFILFLFLIAACSNDADNSTEPPDSSETDDEQEVAAPPAEPVTIKIAIPLGEDYFQGRFGPIEEKLEHIELEQVPYGGTSESLQELFANGENPDIIISDIAPMQELGVIEPLEELIEKHDFDLDSINPGLISFIRSLDSEGRMIGIPDGRSFLGLYYNKDVFDLFGVPYPDPEKPMTWQELIDLTRKLTGERDGTNYIGLDGGPATWPLQAFAVNATDPETGDVLITENPVFREYFGLMDQYYSIPGVHDPDQEGSPFAERTAAMALRTNNFFLWGFGGAEPHEVESIDIAPVPVWEEQPTIGPYLHAWPMVIANYSEHKDEAFQVLMEYASPEIQTEMAKTMTQQTILSDPAVLEQYGAEVDYYEGKNLSAYFALDAALFKEQQSKWNGYVDLGAALTRLAEEGIDVNTLLQQVKEESEVKIQEAMLQEH